MGAGSSVLSPRWLRILAIQPDSLNLNEYGGISKQLRSEIAQLGVELEKLEKELRKETSNLACERNSQCYEVDTVFLWDCGIRVPVKIIFSEKNTPKELAQALVKKVELAKSRMSLSQSGFSLARPGPICSPSSPPLVAKGPIKCVRHSGKSVCQRQYRNASR